MRPVYAVLIVLAIPIASMAQPVGGLTQGWSVEPSSRDTYLVRFEGRTLSSAGTPAITLRKSAQSDSTPSQILATATVQGSDLALVLAPDTGCGTSGCRAGNVYQIRVQPTDSAGNQPTAVLRVDVRWEAIVP